MKRMLGKVFSFQGRRVHSAENAKRSPRLSTGFALSPEEARMVRGVRAEHGRRGGFLRIFPSPESWKRYASFLGNH